MRTARRAGGRWRFLAHRIVGRESIEFQATDFDPNEFDELVVGQWLHVEQMDTNRWWMNIGGVTVWVTADRDGRPKCVTVYGPDSYDSSREGCKYGLMWT